ncbi:hypothetical protein [Bacillus sp. NPDC094077]|uniref:hypothetical protein n=1 Tax=Bacillus sp. NPDC094077 TaxID=3390932 RepID=UPI003D04D7B6
MDTIVVNDVELQCASYGEIIDDNGEVNAFDIGLHVKGKNNYYMIKNLFKGTIKLLFTNTQSEYRVKVDSVSSRYQDELTDDTNIDIRYILSIVDEEESDDTLQGRTIKQLFEAQLKIRTLTEILMEKEIATKEELENKFQSVIQRDGKKLIEELTGVSYKEDTEENE